MPEIICNKCGVVKGICLCDIERESTHLDDGAYATICNEGVWITANHHELDKCTDKILLSFNALEALANFLKRVSEQKA